MSGKMKRLAFSPLFVAIFLVHASTAFAATCGEAGTDAQIADHVGTPVGNGPDLKQVSFKFSDGVLRDLRIATNSYGFSSLGETVGRSVLLFVGLQEQARQGYSRILLENPSTGQTLVVLINVLEAKSLVGNTLFSGKAAAKTRIVNFRFDRGFSKMLDRAKNDARLDSWGTTIGVALRCVHHFYLRSQGGYTKVLVENPASGRQRTMITNDMPFLDGWAN